MTGNAYENYENGLLFVQALKDGRERDPYHSHLHMVFTEVSLGRVTMQMEPQEEIHANAFGFAHGGSLGSVFDAACGYAFLTTMSKGRQAKLINKYENILKSVVPGGGVVTVTAEKIISGNSTGHMMAKLYQNNECKGYAICVIGTV